MKKEAFADIEREEKLIKSKIQRGRLRAKEWLIKRLDDTDRSSQASDETKKEHQWELTQLEDLALRTGPNDTPIHIVFSTNNCEPDNYWQAYQFFLAALRVRQPGRITQIASGCKSDAEKQAIRDWHAEHIVPLSMRFGLHLTPHFSSEKVVPYGIKHWMEHGKGMGIDPTTELPWKHDTIIALLDADQLLLKPITGYFSSPDDIFRGGSNVEGGTGDNIDMLLSQDNESQFMVRHGHPLAQEYGLRDIWRKYAHVAGPDSPAAKVTSNEAMRSYSVGPPYIATALDFYIIAANWCEFVPKIYKEYPQALATTHAYSIAAAHLSLKHQLMGSLMVSDTATAGGGGDGEGWTLVDAIPGDKVCAFALNSLDPDEHQLPSSMFFSHRYGVGDKAFFSKKKVPSNYFSCDSPLLEEPPLDIGSGKYLYKKPPFRDTKVSFSNIPDIAAVIEKREAFIVCAATGFLNEGAQFYKNRHCGGKANLKKEINLHDLPE